MIILCWMGWHFWERHKRHALNPKNDYVFHKCYRCGIERHGLGFFMGRTGQ